MKCPHCNKEIVIPQKKQNKFEKYMELLPLNMIAYMVVTAVLMSALTNYFKIPWDIQNGANLNYDMFVLFIPVIFILIYVGFYVNKKVRGKLLIFK